jgi:polysaccharide pyruvyl transferase WcaK-like protein
LFTVRDKYAHQLLNDLNIPNHLLPCTATWASHYCNINKKSNDCIALVPPSIGVMPPEQVGASNSVEMTVNLLNTYQMLETTIKQKFPNKTIKIVPHGIKEYGLFSQSLHHSQIFYSNNAQSLLEFYSNCEFVISGRLHGALPAFGIEGAKVVSVETDTRGAATELFNKIHRVKLRAIAENEEAINNLVKNLDKIEPSSKGDLSSCGEQYEELLKSHFAI